MVNTLRKSERLFLRSIRRGAWLGPFLLFQAHHAAVEPARVAEKTYTNERFHYTVSYPPHWFPSGNTYANAYELRNYDPKNPASVPEGNRAAVVIVDTVNESPEATEAFLRDLIGGAGAAEVAEGRAAGRTERLTIDGHPAVRVRRKVPARSLGPGAARTTSTREAPDGAPRTYLSVATYVANGRHVLSVEGSAPSDIDPAVIEEITRIGLSVKFGNPRR